MQRMEVSAETKKLVGKQKLQPVRNTEYLPCIHRERSDKKKWQFLMGIRNFQEKGAIPAFGSGTQERASGIQHPESLCKRGIPTGTQKEGDFV